MQLRPNLFFSGNAEDALRHYAAALGGEIELMRFAGSPAAEAVPPEWSEKILYGSVRSAYGQVNVMDAPPGREGTPGDNFAIAVDVDDEDSASAIFAKLGAGGNVNMPFETTFFAKKFGMVTDKFGIKWMVNVAPAAVGIV
jgi:PhnB protein